MTDNHLDREFIEYQRKRLEEIRGELRRQSGEVQEERLEHSQEEQDATIDASDSSTYIFDREVDATVERQEKKRLAFVERALAKVEEGTYGICDDTGEPIQRGRLEAVPEAIYTLEAEQRHERYG